MSPVNRRDPLRNTGTAARWAWCPECRAQPGNPCIGARGQPRKGCHRGRWNSYRDLAQLPPTAPL